MTRSIHHAFVEHPARRSSGDEGLIEFDFAALYPQRIVHNFDELAFLRWRRLMERKRPFETTVCPLDAFPALGPPRKQRR